MRMHRIRTTNRAVTGPPIIQPGDFVLIDLWAKLAALACSLLRHHLDRILRREQFRIGFKTCSRLSETRAEAASAFAIEKISIGRTDLPDIEVDDARAALHRGAGFRGVLLPSDRS